MTRSPIFASLALVAACGAGEPRPAVPVQEAGAPTALDASAPLLDAGAPEASVEARTETPPRLEPLGAEPPAATPHVEIVSPFAEQRILIPKAAAYAVRLKLEGASEGVALALDGERPRRVRDASAIKLSDLTAEGEAPAQGAHWLRAAALDARGAIVRSKGGSLAPFAAVRFWVGDRPSPAPPVEPSVALLSPHGTYNGPKAADGVVIDFLAAPERLGAPKGAALVELAGKRSRVEARLTSWQPLAVRDLPSGDFDVSVTLLDDKGAALSRVRRTITINRDVGAEDK